MRKNPFHLEVVSVRLVKDAPIMSEHPITSPETAVSTLGKYMSEFDREIVCVVNLKNDGTPINCSFVSTGCLSEAMAHPREIFKASILSNAASMILIHNHPSGNLFPSKHDTIITDRMVKNCEIMGINLIDHIIVGGDNSRYFSFREKDMIKNPQIVLETDYRAIDMEPVLIAEDGKVR